MKKILILTAVLGFVSLTVSAQGLYFDIGGGFGKTWTQTDGADQLKMWKSAFGEAYKDAGIRINIDDVIGELAFNLEARAGYGPFGTLPLFFVVEFDWVGHNIYIQRLDFSALYNSFLVGPGVIYYPWRLLQVGASVGYSFTADSIKSVPDGAAISMPDGAMMLKSKGGFAWNVSLGVNLGTRYAFLVGAKYFFSVNVLEKDSLRTTSMIGFFMKYAFRPKTPLEW